MALRISKSSVPWGRSIRSDAICYPAASTSELIPPHVEAQWEDAPMDPAALGLDLLREGRRKALIRHGEDGDGGCAEEGSAVHSCQCIRTIPVGDPDC